MLAKTKICHLPIMSAANTIDQHSRLSFGVRSKFIAFTTLFFVPLTVTVASTEAKQANLHLITTSMDQSLATSANADPRSAKDESQTTSAKDSVPAGTKVKSRSAGEAKIKAIPSTCELSSKRVFVCITKSNRKRIEVCEADTTFVYSFGKVGATPELMISVPKTQVTGFQWSGFGRYINYAIDFPNGVTQYSVYSSVERDPNGTSEAGVSVSRNGNRIAKIKCDMTTTDSDLNGLTLNKRK